MSNEILPQLVYSLSEQNRFYKQRAAAFVLRAVAKHSPPLAQAVVDSGARLNFLVQCLEEFDPGVKESAAWALGYIAGHNADLAATVVESGAVPLLVLCVQEPELSLSASRLRPWCVFQDSPELGVGRRGELRPRWRISITPSSPPTRSSSARCARPSARWRSTASTSRIVVECAKSFRPSSCVSGGAGGPAANVRKHAATAIREVAKHTPELAQLIFATEASPRSSITSTMPGFYQPTRRASWDGRGYISAFSETLAMGIIASIVLGVAPLYAALSREPEDHVKSASACRLGQIGRHTPDHAKAVADAGVLAKLVAVGWRFQFVLVWRLARRSAFARLFIVEKLTDLGALDRTLGARGLPAEVVKFVVHQISKVLPNDPQGRHDFVTGGGLAAVQALDAQSGTALKEYVDVIKSCYPEEIVQYYSPTYATQLLEKLEVTA